MRVLVTGATGFIGGAIVRRLATDPTWSILATGRAAFHPIADLPGVDYLQADLSEATDKLHADICIHCAGLADDRATQEDYDRHNVRATALLMQRLEGCRTFIFISSSSVYDFSDGNARMEADTLTHPGPSGYGRSKLEAEEMVCRSGLPSIYIFRPRAVYGPGDRVLLPRLLAMMNHYRILAPGHLAVYTNMTHIHNLVHAVELAMWQSSPGTHIYNVADRERYFLKEVIGQIAFQYYGHRRFVHVPLWLVRLLSKMAIQIEKPPLLTDQAIGYLSCHSLLDIDRLVHELDFQPEINFWSSCRDLNTRK